MKVTPAEAWARMQNEGFVYVDVRSPDEFAEGHPRGAVNVPLDDAFVPEMERRFAKDAGIVVGCASGRRSARACEALVAAGFGRVLDQRAGFGGVRGTFGEVVEPGWLRVGLPFEP